RRMRSWRPSALVNRWGYVALTSHRPPGHDRAMSPTQGWVEQEIDAELDRIDAEGLRRRLTLLESGSDAEVVVDGRRCVLLSSNNSLGLASHPALATAAHLAIERYGCGAGSSRLIAGSLDLHAEVETRLARFKGTEAALLFASGYQANVGAVTALV